MLFVTFVRWLIYTNIICFLILSVIVQAARKSVKKSRRSVPRLKAALARSINTTLEHTEETSLSLRAGSGKRIVTKSLRNQESMSNSSYVWIEKDQICVIAEYNGKNVGHMYLQLIPTVIANPNCYIAVNALDEKKVLAFSVLKSLNLSYNTIDKDSLVKIRFSATPARSPNSTQLVYKSGFTFGYANEFLQLQQKIVKITESTCDCNSYDILPGATIAFNSYNPYNKTTSSHVRGLTNKHRVVIVNRHRSRRLFNFIVLIEAFQKRDYAVRYVDSTSSTDQCISGYEAPLGKRIGKRLGEDHDAQ